MIAHVLCGTSCGRCAHRFTGCGRRPRPRSSYWSCDTDGASSATSQLRDALRRSDMTRNRPRRPRGSAAKVCAEQPHASRSQLSIDDVSTCRPHDVKVPSACNHEPFFHTAEETVLPWRVTPSVWAEISRRPLVHCDKCVDTSCTFSTSLQLAHAWRHRLLRYIGELTRPAVRPPPPQRG